MKWSIINNATGKSHQFEGTFDQAIAVAQASSSADGCRRELWLSLRIWLAEVSPMGRVRHAETVAGAEVVRMMRLHRVTIAQLARRAGVTQRRIRQLRSSGLAGGHSVRDWLQQITGEDLGPLPAKSRLQRHQQAAACGCCEKPLNLKGWVYQYAGQLYCSLLCCRKHAGWSA